jgi:hypothetical protein
VEEKKGYFSSKVYNKKILLIGSSVGISTYGFTGLNFDTYTNDIIEIQNNNDIKSLKTNKFDFIFIHGFLLRELKKDFNLTYLKESNINCDEFIIDYSGEGYSLFDDMNWLLKYLKLFSFNKIKIITPLDNIEILEKKYPTISFFKTNKPGLSFFCSPFNHMLHESVVSQYEHTFDKFYGHYVYSGLNWDSSKKDYLFMCLNNREDVHRAFLINDILDNKLETEGIISCNFGGDFNRSYNFYNSKLKNDEDSVIIKLDKIELNDNKNLRFSPNFNYSKNSYIDVITETYPRELMFITEKTAKPFFNLQFPIIFGPVGIIQKLRDYGFDMFDDIINHDYDDEVFEYEYETDYYIQKWNLFLFKKSKKIVKELERLSKLDFYKIYLKSKHRLLYNQELINKICIDDNNILFDMGEYIFGDSIIYCYEPTFIKHKY